MTVPHRPADPATARAPHPDGPSRAGHGSPVTPAADDGSGTRRGSPVTGAPHQIASDVLRTGAGSPVTPAADDVSETRAGSVVTIAPHQAADDVPGAGAGSPVTPAPPVRRNDYGTLRPPALGSWEPRLTVSVVIPAYECQEALDRTLAGLAAQTYPAHLMEVVVADDGSTPALRVPAVAPEATRIVRVPAGRWGRGWARQTGAEAASGDVVHWVDSDMILARDHIEAHMRWHHLASYAVVHGRVAFVADDVAPPPPEDVLAGAYEGGAAFGEARPHGWTAEVLRTTRELRDEVAGAYRLHSGATTSVAAWLLRAAGGVNTSLNMAEDTDLGYRLAQRGAVFIPDPEARAWHLGTSTVMRREADVHRHNWSFLGDLIPDLRWLRRHPRRRWAVPYVEVVIDAHGASYERVRASVDAALAGTVADTSVVLLGPWDELPSGRRASLDEPMLDTRLAYNLYEHEPRVRFVRTASESCAPTPFRVTCPAGWVLGPDSLAKLVGLAERDGYGLVSVALDETPAGVTALRLERTSAFSRAALVAADGPGPASGTAPPGFATTRPAMATRPTPDSMAAAPGPAPGSPVYGVLDALVDEMYGSIWVAAAEYGVVTDEEAEPVGGDPAKWRADAARWRSEATRLRAEVARLEAELRHARDADADGARHGGDRRLVGRLLRELGRR
ncbi:glycosyltransferase [Microtetraspora niveoalba]|uniref:glycosyltransferase n=1 Tax=Microtetraspora niveoalba TaxID=46175 RepID=UPI0009FBECD4|nr:glycosyltransferase family 2 protein [Microtetraspora niveoalba]